jgi:hypothetical protein
MTIERTLWINLGTLKAHGEYLDHIAVGDTLVRLIIRLAPETQASQSAQLIANTSV